MSRDENDRKLANVRLQQKELAQFGSFALRENEVDKVLEEAARIASECMRVSYCKVCRYRADHNDLIVEAGHGWMDDVVHHAVQVADMTTPAGRAFITRRPVIVKDLRLSDDYVLPPMYADHEIISTVNVLIGGNGNPWGVLEIDSTDQIDYDSYDIDFLQGFANVLAEVLDHKGRKNELLVNAMRLERLVSEKDVLAGELRHRVRNNLQFIYAVVYKEANKTQDESAKRAMRGIAGRIMTLSEVYDHLTDHGVSSAVDLGDYLESLCSEVADFRREARGRIQLATDMEHYQTGLDTATSLGLIVAELVSNSFDHAFPDGEGKITVSLSQSADRWRLVVRDNGIGFDPGKSTNRRGLTLAQGLASQVDAEMAVSTAGGTVWTITWQEET